MSAFDDPEEFEIMEEGEYCPQCEKKLMLKGGNLICPKCRIIYGE